MHPIHQALDYAARALGFSAVGIADALAPQGETLAGFIRDGKHADMEWMARHLPARRNPELVLPGVRRIIMLTYEYPRQDARKAAGLIDARRYPMNNIAVLLRGVGAKLSFMFILPVTIYNAPIRMMKGR